MFNLKDKKVIITGATGGIGNSIIKSFVQQEAKVLATGTNEEKLKSLKNTNNDIITKKFDISNHNDIEKFIEDNRVFNPEYILYSFINEKNLKIRLINEFDLALIRVENSKPTKVVYIPLKDKIKMKIAKQKIKLLKFKNRLKLILK